jgi:adenylate cyclase
VGDAYMAVAGVPTANRRHAIDACLTALEMLAVVSRMKTMREKMRLPALEIRVGLHSGPVMSGVVGKNKFTFDIWGEAVNTAALMEANGSPGRVNVSESVAGHAKTLFELEPRGPIVAKHDKAHEIFFLNRLKPEFSRDAEGRAPNQAFAPECSRLLTGFSG